MTSSMDCFSGAWMKLYATRIRMATMGTTTMTPAKIQMMNRKKMANGLDQGGDCGRREELPHGLELLEVLGKGTGRGRAGPIFIPITLAKILADSSTSDFFAGDVDEVAAQLAHHEIEGNTTMAPTAIPRGSRMPDSALSCRTRSW